VTGTTQPAVTADARDRTRARLVAPFAVYLVLLVWAVLWKLELPWVGEAGWRIVKLVPFVATDSAGASTRVDVVANLALFVPFGVYLGLLAPAWPWWRTAGTLAASSLGLEVAQYVLAVGSTDLTDVLVNTAGGLAGLGLLRLVHRSFPGRSAAILDRACAVGTVVAVLLSTLVVVSPVRFGPPEDVLCSRSAPCGPPGAPGDREPPRDAVLSF
jgi:glycopeptide antibiotics resistance protein